MWPPVPPAAKTTRRLWAGAEAAAVLETARSWLEKERRDWRGVELVAGYRDE